MLIRVDTPEGEAAALRLRELKAKAPSALTMSERAELDSLLARMRGRDDGRLMTLAEVRELVSVID